MSLSCSPELLVPWSQRRFYFFNDQPIEAHDPFGVAS